MQLGATVEEAQERVSSQAFAYWVAYYALEPFGYHTENWRMGVVASTVANCAPRGKKAKALKPADFCPPPIRVPQKMTHRQRIELAARRAGKAPAPEVRIGNRLATPSEAASILAGIAAKRRPLKPRSTHERPESPRNVPAQGRRAAAVR